MIVFVVISEGRFINQSSVINLIEAKTAVHHENSIKHLYIELRYNQFNLNIFIQANHIPVACSHIYWCKIAKDSIVNS